MALSIDGSGKIDPVPVTELPDDQKEDTIKLASELELLALTIATIVKRSKQTEFEAVGLWFPVTKNKEIDERLNSDFQVARDRMKEILALF